MIERFASGGRDREHMLRAAVLVLLLLVSVGGCSPSAVPPSTPAATTGWPAAIQTASPTHDLPERTSLPVQTASPTSDSSGQTPFPRQTEPPPPEGGDTPAPACNAVTVSGTVIGGGDTTPQGLQDAPRRYAFTIETDDKSHVIVTYTAFPPSPAGSAGTKIRLDLNAGTILIGDTLTACGSYDPGTNTLTVAEEGDYIETRSQPSP